ncbi:MAG: hypothetical protein U9Q82_10050 [Chloroflexota bacterium]|nr:hypothetical protein [Chloroflexota bacterium]
MSDTDKSKKEPYNFDDATIDVAITLLPDDGHEDGRKMILGVRSHDAPPKTRISRIASLDDISPHLVSILDEWENHLPNVQYFQMKAEADKNKKRSRQKAADPEPGQRSLFDDVDDESDKDDIDAEEAS